MRPAPRKYGWLVRLRQLAVLLLVAECADVYMERVFGFVAIPDGADVVVCLVAFAIGVFAEFVERVSDRVRLTVHADSHELETRRQQEHEQAVASAARRARMERILEGSENPQIVFQPIVDLRTGAVSGYEALSRFKLGRPDELFAEAAAVGLGVELELKAIGRAVDSLAELPGDAPYLSVNASPETLMSPELVQMLTDLDSHRVVVELTEHVSIGDYDAVRAAVAALRELGVRLAVDDVGAGYSSLRHIATLEPDIIKVDRSFTQSLSSDATERSMVAAIVGLGQAVGATIVAEGIEDPSGMKAARDLGVHAGQGWYIGKPKALAELPRPKTAAARAHPLRQAV